MEAVNFDFKVQLINVLIGILKERVSELRDEIHISKTESAEAFKSTAGDKHEVGREMATAELEKLNQQLAEKKRILFELDSLSIEPSSKIAIGTLVCTNKGIFLVAVPFGRLKHAGQDVYVISENSPLAKEFLGRSVGEVAIFNKSTYQIEALY